MSVFWLAWLCLGMKKQPRAYWQLKRDRLVWISNGPYMYEVYNRYYSVVVHLATWSPLFTEWLGCLGVCRSTSCIALMDSLPVFVGCLWDGRGSNVLIMGDLMACHWRRPQATLFHCAARDGGPLMRLLRQLQLLKHMVARRQLEGQIFSRRWRLGGPGGGEGQTTGQTVMAYWY